MSKIKIPKYTLGEELMNAITHGVGAILGIVALVLTLIEAIKGGNSLAILAASLYGSSMIIMYLISCLYHSFSPRITAKKVFRVLDHCDIYVFIAGSYTPYCLCVIEGLKGWIMFSVVWVCAIVGVLLNSINLEKFKKPSFALYLIMGWSIIFSINTIFDNLESVGILLLFLGGVVYTVGAILYGIGKKKKYLHSIFHFCVLIASILQFFSIYLYVL